jgi:hypothetical protein
MTLTVKYVFSPRLLLFKGDLKEGHTCIRNDTQTIFSVELLNLFLLIARQIFMILRVADYGRAVEICSLSFKYSFLALLCLHEATS